MGDLLMVTHSRAQSHWWCLWGALAHVQTPAGRMAGRGQGAPDDDDSGHDGQAQQQVHGNSSG